MYVNEVPLTDYNTEKTIETLTTRLNLSESQEKEIRLIVEKQAEMRIQLREIEGGDRTNIRARMKEFREQDNILNEKIKSHLTELQQAEFEKLQKELMKSKEMKKKELINEEESNDIIRTDFGSTIHRL